MCVRQGAEVNQRWEIRCERGQPRKSNHRSDLFIHFCGSETEHSLHLCSMNGDAVTHREGWRRSVRNTESRCSKYSGGNKVLRIGEIRRCLFSGDKWGKVVLTEIREGIRSTLCAERRVFFYSRESIHSHSPLSHVASP